MFHYMNEKIGTFNVKYEIVLYTPVFNARCPPPHQQAKARSPFNPRRATQCILTTLLNPVSTSNLLQQSEIHKDSDVFQHLELGRIVGKKQDKELTRMR